MNEHSFLGENKKLTPKCSGHHKILHLKGDTRLEIQLKHNGRRTVVHANRLKPYFVASKNSSVFNRMTKIFLSPRTTLKCIVAFYLHMRRSQPLNHHLNLANLPLPLALTLLLHPAHKRWIFPTISHLLLPALAPVHKLLLHTLPNLHLSLPISPLTHCPFLKGGEIGE